MFHMEHQQQHHKQRRHLSNLRVNDMNGSSDLGESPIADAASDVLRHSLNNCSKVQPSIKKTRRVLDQTHMNNIEQWTSSPLTLSVFSTLLGERRL